MAELPERLSAQVITTVSDYSRISSTPDQAVLGVVTATTGPINELKLIKTTSALVSTFGEPSANHIGLCGAYKIIEAGNAMYLVRVAHEESVAAASCKLWGDGGSVLELEATASGSGASSVTLGKIVESDYYPQSAKGKTLSFTHGSGNTWTVTLDDVEVPSSVSSDGLTITVESYNLSAVLNQIPQSQGSFAVAFSEGSDYEKDYLTVEAEFKGTAGNSNSISVFPSEDEKYEIVLFKNGLKSSSTVVSLDEESEDFVLDVKIDGIKITLPEGRDLPLSLDEADETPFEGGNDGVDGIEAEDYVGEFNEESGEATGAQLFRQPSVVAQMYPALGYTDKAYLNAMKVVSNEKKYVTCIFDPPNGKTLSGAIDWLEDEEDGVLGGWMCETYWPWCKDSYNGYPLVMPPSVYVTINSMDCFRRFGPQLPVAGSPRGILSGVTAVTEIPSVSSRDKLITHRINPIWNTGVDGTQIFGNETLNEDYTDLRSAHIARMLAQIITQINAFTQTLEFELNDALTWQRWIDGAGKILQPYKDKRGLKWYGLRMGLDTTSAAEIAQRQIRGQIGLQFTQDAEVFWLNYAVFASSAEEIDF